MSLRIRSNTATPLPRSSNGPSASAPTASTRTTSDGFDAPRKNLVSLDGAGEVAYAQQTTSSSGTNGVNMSRAEVFSATDAAAAQYDLPPEVMRAIALQESGATQWTSSGGTVRNDNSNGTTDWGVMQLNTEGWLGSGLDVNRAKSDERYNIQQGAHELRVASDYWFNKKYGHPFSMKWYQSLPADQQKEARIDLFRSYNGWLPDTSNATPYENKIESGETGKVGTPAPKPGSGSPSPGGSSSSPSVSVPQAQLTYDGGTNYNPQVEQLQRCLVKAGYLSQSDMNTGPGYYGPKTKAAVAKLQADHGIVGDGGVDYGPQTRAALSQALASAKNSGGSTPAPGTGSSSQPSGGTSTKAPSDGSLQRWNVPYINQMHSAGSADDWNASSNCGPTTMAMIAKGLGYGTSMVDGDLVNHFDQVAGVGSDGVGYPGIETMAKSAGFSSQTKEAPTAAWVQQQLEAGKLVAANGDRAVTLDNEKPPHASGNLTGGHWIAVVGMTKDGNFLVQDPSTTCKELSPSQLERFFRAHGSDGGWAVAIGNGKQGNTSGSKSSGGTQSSGGSTSTSSPVSVPQGQLTYDGGTNYNPQVEQLQGCLVKAGYLSQSDMNTGPGYYGPKTKAAVAKLQADYGIVGDGGVDYGPQTRAALSKALGSAKNGGTPTPAPKGSGSTPPSTGKPEAPKYDGSKPASGTTNQDGWIPTTPPETGSPSNRSTSKYDNVINQFAVANNPRYTPRGGNTFCNIFLWDVTRAMGAEIPHWVDSSGRPTSVGNGRELDANDTELWLEQHGAQYGWHQATPEEAQEAANQGKPAAFAWNNPGSIGHVGVVRPGTFDPNLGPEIAQAGAENTNDTHVGNIFTSSSHGGGGYQTPTYWVHD